jgi:hypothetical protein
VPTGSIRVTGSGPAPPGWLLLVSAVRVAVGVGRGGDSIMGQRVVETAIVSVITVM